MMDLQAEKLELVKLLIATESKEVIKEVKSVLTGVYADFWDALDEKAKESIYRGLEDVRYGRVHSHDSVMKEIQSKYGLPD